MGSWERGEADHVCVVVVVVCYVRFEIIVEGVEWRGETLRRIEFSL
jgi:hypothetical protein